MALLIFATLIVVFRWHTYNEPLERDITTYAIIGHELLAGRPLYCDLWDHKPPAIYLTYALGELFFAYGNSAVYALNVIAAIVTLIAVYIAGLRYSGGVVTGLIAAAFWVLLSQSLRLEANQPNSEAFINCCLAIIFAILINSKRLGKKIIFFTGLVTAWASLYKPIALLPVCFLLTARIVFFVSQTRKEYFKEAASIATITVLVWFVVAMWFMFTGSFPDFYQAVFVFNALYMQECSFSLQTCLQWLCWGFALDSYVRAILAISTVIAIIKIIRRGPLYKLWIAWLAYLVGIVIAIILQNHPFAHYFQLTLPMAAVGCAWGLNSLQSVFRYTVLYICIVLATISLLLYDRMKDLFLPANEWSQRKYFTLFVDQREMGEKLKSLLFPNETLYVWGKSPGLYFYGQRRPASGLLYNDPLTGGPFTEKLSARVIEQLSTKQPPLIIYSCDTNKNEADKIIDDRYRGQAMAQYPVTAWIACHYCFYKMIEIDRRYFALFLLPNSRIYSQLRSPATNNISY